jgi:hypothetical protein
MSPTQRETFSAVKVPAELGAGLLLAEQPVGAVQGRK